MNAQVFVLLVGCEGGPFPRLRSSLERHENVRLLFVPGSEDALTGLDRFSPDLIIGSCCEEPGAFLGLCQRIRETPELREVRIVMILDPLRPETKVDAFDIGVREFMVPPVEPEEMLARISEILNLKRVRGQVTAMRAEIDAVRRGDRRRTERLVDSLASMIDMRLPGSSRRGSRIEGIAAQMAARFGIPVQYLHGLEVAARLHEIGRMPPLESPEGWRYVLASKAILKEIDGFEEAADLVGDIYENWDGSGFPGHMLCGQIPLRSRILRAAIDLVTALERPSAGGADPILRRMATHGGTLYDPMVIVHLRSLLERTPTLGAREEGIAIHVDELEVGMILLEDLVTSSGIKLLSRGTVLDETVLSVVRNRSESDPILRGAMVRRRMVA